jgi:hypothetical protein
VVRVHLDLFVVWFLAVFLVGPELHGQTVCGLQNYDSEEPPNFSCPGPEESSMVPMLNPPPSVPVEAGDLMEAQWPGALVHRDRLILMGLRLTASRRLRWADRQRLAGTYRLELDDLREQNRIQEEFLEEQAAALRQRVVAAERRATRATVWYQSVWFGLVLGLATAALLVVGAAYLVTTI